MMLKRLRDLENWTIEAHDGTDIGTIENFYFDDEDWVVRYLTAATGSWFTGRSVLISPRSFKTLDKDRECIRLTLSRDELAGAPSADTNRPITRDFESAYSSYYGYSPYWGAGIAGAVPISTTFQPAPGSEPVPIGADNDPNRSHLRSINEVSGYHIRALDGDIGHVEDFIADITDWQIRYLTVDTSNWIGGRVVLVSPEWVRRVDWTERKIHVETTRNNVKDSPEYNPTIELDREYENKLHHYYRRPAYWER